MAASPTFEQSFERRRCRSGEVGMVKVSVLYPNSPGANFDHEYYRQKHMPLVQERLGKACMMYTIDVGLAGSEPDSSPPFVAGCHIYSSSPEIFWEALAPHAREIAEDMENYTDIAPLMQVSEVISSDISLEHFH